MSFNKKIIIFIVMISSIINKETVVNSMILGFISYPNVQEAKSHAKQLVQNDLVACAKVIEGMTSYYKWEGNLEEDNESYVIIKSLNSKVKEIEAFIQLNHSNKVHEFIYSQVESANDDYFKWVSDNLINNKKTDI